MSSFSSFSTVPQANGLPATSTPSSSPAPGFSATNGPPSSSSSISVLNNGPTSSTSPNTMAISGSPVANSVRADQIKVPTGAGSSHSGGKPVTPSSGSKGGATPVASDSGGGGTVLDRSRLRELVKEVDPLEQMDDDVEDVLLQVADDFIENVVAASCQLAKHRRSNTLETKDVQLYLERNWNIQVPGFGSDDIRPYKKSLTTEAHKQRMALIRKTLKKY